MECWLKTEEFREGVVLSKSPRGMGSIPGRGKVGGGGWCNLSQMPSGEHVFSCGSCWATNAEKPNDFRSSVAASVSVAAAAAASVSAAVDGNVACWNFRKFSALEVRKAEKRKSFLGNAFQTFPKSFLFFFNSKNLRFPQFENIPRWR